MTEKVAGSLPESGLSQTEGDSGAHSSGASSSAENLGAGESKDSASRTEVAEGEEPDSGPSKGKGLSQEPPSTSGGTQDSEAASDNASLSSDDATPTANGSVAGLEWAQPVISTLNSVAKCKSSSLKKTQDAYDWKSPSQDHEEDHFDDADSALGDDR